MKQLVILFLVIFSIMGCEKEEVTKNVNGILLAPTDHCDWLIRTKDSQFDPINLADFPITLRDSLEVKFSYKPSGGNGICMSGLYIKIKSIKEK